MEDTAKQVAEFSSGPDVRLKHKLIQAANDMRGAQGFEHLAVRLFIFRWLFTDLFVPRCAESL